MAFDYSMLKKRIREQFGNVTEFCQSCGLDELNFLRKVNNKKEFCTDEVVKISEELDIPTDEIRIYFFTEL